VSGEHSDKFNSKIEQISFWQWVGRVVPMVLIVGLLLFYFFYNHELSLWVSIIIFLCCFIPIIWWWWALDTMKWLGGLYVQTLNTHSTILKELSNLKKEIFKKNNE